VIEETRSAEAARHDYVAREITVGMLVDPTLCTGCMACEVACTEWNGLPRKGAAAPVALGNSHWRGVTFVPGEHRPSVPIPAPAAQEDRGPGLFFPDSCRHCGVAACLEACPTRAIERTAVGSVRVLDDLCNGCGYCVVACPFGVVDLRGKGQPGAGGAFLCTFCDDRLAEGLVPACVKVCPSEAIRFGPLHDLRPAAERRAGELRETGIPARLYDPLDSSVGGVHALFLYIGEPEDWGCPSAPEAPGDHLDTAWFSALLAALGAVILTLVAFGL